MTNIYDYFRNRQEMRQIQFQSYLSNERSQQKFISTFQCQERLADSDCFSRGVLLDGFPRTRAQAGLGVFHFWGAIFQMILASLYFETLISSDFHILPSHRWEGRITSKSWRGHLCCDSFRGGFEMISSLLQLQSWRAVPLNLLIYSIELWFIAMFDVKYQMINIRSIDISWHVFILAWR